MLPGLIKGISRALDHPRKCGHATDRGRACRGLPVNQRSILVQCSVNRTQSLSVFAVNSFHRCLLCSRSFNVIYLILGAIYTRGHC